jgi:lysozyme
MAMLMQISDAGIELVKRYEGFRPQVYNDIAGHPTIGYGHELKPGESFPNGITEAEAEVLLRQDLAIAEAAVNQLVTVALTQSQFDALVDFVYNEGAGHFESSTLLAELNQGQYADVPTELRKWVYAGGKVVPGLVARRNEEAELWSS